MTRCAFAAVIFGLIALHARAGTPATELFPSPTSRDVIDLWEVQFDTAVLWSVGDKASPLSYTFAPQILTLKTPRVLHARLGSGDLIVRTRVSFLGEAITQGPESYFAGVSFSPSIEWWNRARSLAVFYSVGGGVGWMDARGYDVAGGQGQDFNLHWFMHGGMKYRLNESFSAAFGVMFQHISNGGQNKINPGVNALGPTLGLSFHF